MGMEQREKRKHKPSELNSSSLIVGNQEFFLGFREGKAEKAIYII